MTVTEFEEVVWEIETIRLVIRADLNEEVGDYPYQNAADKTLSLTRWLQGRVQDQLEGYSVQVVDGYGEQPHGRTALRNIRASYEAE